MLVEMKFQGHGLSTMISMLFDMNTHFWFRGHSKRHAINWRSTRAEFYQVGAYPQLWAGKTPSQMRTTAASSDFVQGGRASDADDRGGGLAPPIKSLGLRDFWS